jgi:pyruvate,water dikinase
MDELTRRLADLRGADEHRFGGKSAGLGELLSAGINVPPGFALSCAAFELFIAENELHPAIGRGDSGEIIDAIRAAPVPDRVRAEIERAYGLLGADSPPVAVRSSAVGEDSAEATFAGQQETILWVRGADAVCEAVRECWSSLYSREAVTYREHLGDGAAAPTIGVAVQQMVDAEVAGVLFTCNPVSGDRSMVAINASWGLGVAVVGGEVTPDDLLVSKITREIVRESLGTKELEYVVAPSGRGTVRVEVEPERRGRRCIDDEAVAALVAVARAIEAHFGSHQDVEWALARGAASPDGLFVLQSRPVTTLTQSPPAPPSALSAISLVMSKFGAPSPGTGA